MRNLRRTLSMAFVLALFLSAGIFIGRASAAQVHMQNALESLRTARAELNMADADKGGHRVRAVGLVNDAISEVQAGISYARQ